MSPQNSNNPRNQAVTDLVTEIKPLVQNGHNILLMGDFNEYIKSKEGTYEKLREIGLYNVMEERLGTSDLPR